MENNKHEEIVSAYTQQVLKEINSMKSEDYQQETF